MIAARGPLVAFAASVLSIGAARAQERVATPFDYDTLVARAADLAAKPFVAPQSTQGTAFGRLTYDQYRSIRFQTGASIWEHENRNFTVDLFHPGFIYDTPVKVNLVVGGMARRVLFTNKVFDYGKDVPAVEGDEDLGYSGFRVRAPINRPDYLDEFLVFQGASYFRAVARDQAYGLSARGLAVRTARPDGEEFPVFSEFWIERPPEHASEITIHALLESVSVVGAYRFKVRPGTETIMDVDATLVPRVELKHFGIAPLTSMFLFDASNRSRFDDFRDAVHDSDGLEIVNGQGERIWRPLANPRTLQVSAFVDANPRGFGLIQRKRQFADYEDAEARYDRRPSVWVEPRGQWGTGDVELVEIPTDREIHDNIVAYWQPATPLPAHQPAAFSYRLRWTAEPLDESLARVVATRSGRAVNSDARSFVIDYQSPAAAPDDLEVQVTSSSGKILNPRGESVAAAGVYRAAFELDPGRSDAIELRVVLTTKNHPWSETWLYRWTR